MQNPVMYALAYKYETEVFHNFVSEEDDYDMTFGHLLPTKTIAESYIEDVLGSDYFPVAITIVSYQRGTTAFEWETPDHWKDEEDEEAV